MTPTHTTAIEAMLSIPTLLKGVYFSTHRRIVLEYLLWYALTAAEWDDVLPTRARNMKHYLEAVQ